MPCNIFKKWFKSFELKKMRAQSKSINPLFILCNAGHSQETAPYGAPRRTEFATAVRRFQAVRRLRESSEGDVFNIMNPN